MTHSTVVAARLLAGVCLIAFTTGSIARAHDVTTHVTWNREVSRIVYARCATCHRPGGSAFSLLTYQEASPWATAIKENVIQRKMPPWGAVKGFGNFRNDRGLTQEELDLITNWVNGGVPEGNPNDLPARMRIPQPLAVAPGADGIVASGDYRFQRPFKLDGFWVRNGPRNGAAQITIEFPDGRIEPLVWLSDYPAGQQHPFLLRTPLPLPAGALLRGLGGASLALLPAAPQR